MERYQELKIWQKGMNLCCRIYQITDQLPDTEKFGLTSQMRRCAVSIPSNIAEGSYRSTKKDFRSFLFIAKGSAAELQTQLILCNRLKLLQEKDVTIIDADVTELLKMITSFISSMR